MGDGIISFFSSCHQWFNTHIYELHILFINIIVDPVLDQRIGITAL